MALDPATARVTAVVEVTNTLHVPYVTGIQRTVREIIRHWPEDHRVTLLPVVHTGRVFRRLTPDEWGDLGAEPTGPPPQTEQRGGWRSVARAVPGLRSLRDRARDARSWLADRRLGDDRVDLGPGDVLFDLEATWWSPADRTALLPRLARSGTKLAVVIYDLMVLSDPDWFDPDNRAAFVPWAGAQLAHTDLALVYSTFCADAVARFGGPTAPPTARFTPGADPITVEPRRPDDHDDARPFALVLSTIEPRKNLGVVLDAFERLWADGHDVGLVVVGREGWAVDDVVARLREHPESGGRLQWRGWTADAEVDWLYRHAHVVAVPSRAEGYGLPVVEALRRGTPVVSSPGGALAEVGGTAVTHVDPDDVPAWADALGAHLHAGARTAGAPVEAATWSQAAFDVADALAALADRSPPADTPSLGAAD